MKSILGFSINDRQPEATVGTVETDTTRPVRSLVQVRFANDGRVLTYYNDRFALEVGDTVFVDGKLAGKIGTVEKVTTKFKINLADYKRVISKADREIHGTYTEIMDKMVSFDAEAFSPDQFRTWVIAPRVKDDDEEDEDDVVIVGDGYELDLTEIEKSDDVNYAVLQRAVDYCANGSVAYICVRDGVGTAFINGTTWYEVNFALNGDSLTEKYISRYSLQEGKPIIHLLTSKERHEKPSKSIAPQLKSQHQQKKVTEPNTKKQVAEYLKLRAASRKCKEFFQISPNLADAFLELGKAICKDNSSILVYSTPSKMGFAENNKSPIVYVFRKRKEFFIRFKKLEDPEPFLYNNLNHYKRMYKMLTL